MFTYLTDISEAKKAFASLTSSSYKSAGMDTETTGLDCHVDKLRLLQIHADGNAYIFDLFKLSLDAFVPLLKGYIDEMRSRKVCLIFHNYSFDLKFLWALGIDLTGCKVFDTMLAVKVLECGLDLPASLKDTLSRHLGLELDKTEQKSDWSVLDLSDSQLGYAAIDTKHMVPLAKTLCQQLIEAELLETFKLEMRALYGFAAMEYYGMKLDTERLASTRPFYEQVLAENLEEFLAHVPVRYVRKDLWGNVVDAGASPTSSQQVLKILQDLQVPNPLYNPKSDSPDELEPIISSTGAPLLKMLDASKFPIIESLLKYKQAQKVLSGYVESLPELVNSVTGRIHTHYNQILTTGRASSSGPNLNQLPRPTGREPLDDNGVPMSIRSCFVPEDGYVFILADYSQIELRLMAHATGDVGMLTEFREEKDPYSATAALVNSRDYSELVTINPNGEDKVKKEYKSLRQAAKAIRLGYNYCLDGDTLVPTSEGVLKLQDITTKHKVLTHLGTYEQVLETQKVFTNKLIKLTTLTGKTLTATVDHPFQVISPSFSPYLRYRYDWVDAGDLTIGNYLVESEHLYHISDATEKIVSIDAVDVVDYPMYDITVDNTHTFIANGVVSHNCMGAAKFQIYARQTYGVTMTLEEAIASRAVYFNAYPGLTSYHARFKNNSLREARTLDKYKRRRLWESYPGPPGLSNVAIQGGAANIQKLAIACIYEELHEKGYSPTQSHDIKQVLTVHDELELEAKLELAEYAREMLSRHMVEAGESIVSTCPIKADASIVMNLAEKD